jgi:hypothetical protein
LQLNQYNFLRKNLPLISLLVSYFNNIDL